MESVGRSRNTIMERLLKSCRIASETSLNGPNDSEIRRHISPTLSSEVRTNKVKVERKNGDEGRRYAIFMTMDTSFSELSSTELEGEMIACFEVGGEKRLCLAQIIRSVLAGFSLPEIHNVFESFRVFSAVCNAGQLNSLIRKEVLPVSALKCGLVTKSDAQRFCSVLLRGENLSCDKKATISSEPFGRKRLSFVYNQGGVEKSDCFGVMHKCFGGCRGTFIQKLYRSSHSPCIRCNECSATLSPKHFVSHFHSVAEHLQTCHWGFDSANWRHYLQLDSRELPEHHETLLKVKRLCDSKVAADDGKEDKKGGRTYVQTSLSSQSQSAVPRKNSKRSLPFDGGHRHQEPPVLLFPPDVNRAVPGKFAPNISLLPVERTDDWKRDDNKPPLYYDDDDDDNDDGDDDDDDDDDDEQNSTTGGSHDRKKRILEQISRDDMAVIQQFDEIQETELRLFRMALDDGTEGSRILTEFCAVQRRLQCLLEGLLNENKYLAQKYEDLRDRQEEKRSSSANRPSSVEGTRFRAPCSQTKETVYFKKRHCRTVSPVSSSAPVRDPTFATSTPRCDSDADDSDEEPCTLRGLSQRPTKRRRHNTYNHNPAAVKVETC